MFKKPKTEKKEIQIGQHILLSDGSIDYVDDFDGSFYFGSVKGNC